MPLKQHKYYVYHEGPIVYARMDDLERVEVQTCVDAQAAHDKVQSIVNPTMRSFDSFQEVDKLGRKMGFHSKEYQDAISDNCEATVKAAYGVN